MPGCWLRNHFRQAGVSQPRSTCGVNLARRTGAIMLCAREYEMLLSEAEAARCSVHEDRSRRPREEISEIYFRKGHFRCGDRERAQLTFHHTLQRTHGSIDLYKSCFFAVFLHRKQLRGLLMHGEINLHSHEALGQTIVTLTSVAIAVFLLAVTLTTHFPSRQSCEVIPTTCECNK